MTARGLVALELLKRRRSQPTKVAAEANLPEQVDNGDGNAGDRDGGNTRHDGEGGGHGTTPLSASGSLYPVILPTGPEY